MPESPLVSIVVVSWNARDYVRRCLLSCEKYLRISHEIIVVDNASGDGTVAMLQAEFPTVHCLANDRNFGFARGNNQGIARARGQWVLVLNDDTEFRDDAVAPLIEYARSQPRCAAVGPELLNPDGTHQQSVRRFPRLADQLIVLFKLRHILRWTGAMRRYLADPVATVRTPIQVDQIMGACMLIPRNALDAIGAFDEGFPNWYEEVEWCHRAHTAGWQIAYAPVSQVVHYGGVSFDQILSIKKHRWMLRGLWRYARLHWPLGRQVIVAPAIAVSYALTIIQTIIKPR